MKKIIFSLSIISFLACGPANSTHASNVIPNIIIVGGLTVAYGPGSYLLESLKIKGSYIQAKLEIEHAVKCGHTNELLGAFKYIAVDVLDNLHQAAREEENKKALIMFSAGVLVASLAYMARN